MALDPFDIQLRRDGETVIATSAISAARILLTQDPKLTGEGVVFVAETSSLDVRADEVEIRGSLKCPGRSISIAARSRCWAATPRTAGRRTSR